MKKRKKRTLTAAACLLAAAVLMILPSASLAAEAVGTAGGTETPEAAEAAGVPYAADAADAADAAETPDADTAADAGTPGLSSVSAEITDTSGIRSILACVNDGIADTDTFFPEGDSVLIPIANENWTCEGPLRRKPQMYPVTAGTSDETVLPLLTAVLDNSEEETGEDARTVTFSLDLTGGGSPADGLQQEYKTLMFGICFEGDEGDFPVSLRIDPASGSGSCTAEVVVRAHPIVPSGSAVIGGSGIVYSRNGWSMVTADLSALTGLPERLTVTVEIPSDSFPGRVDLTAPLLQTSVPEEFAFARTYSVCAFRAEEGTFSAAGGEARCSERNRLTLSGDLAPVPLTGPGTPYCFEIRMSGDPLSDPDFAEGSLSVDLEYLDGTRAENAASFSVPGEGTYSFLAEPSGTLRSVSLRFAFRNDRGEDPAQDPVPVVFRIDSLKLYIGEPAVFPEDCYMGSIARIEVTDDTCRIKGSVSQYALRQYPGGRLRFYAVPAASVVSVKSGLAAFTPVYAADGSYAGARLAEGAVPFGKSHLTSQFEYSVNLSGLGIDPAACLFFVCIQPEGDEAETLPLPLDAPRYPESKTGTAERYYNLSSYGLADALPVGVFEANASRVMENIDLSRLLTPEPQARTTPMPYEIPGEENARAVSLSSSVLSEADRNIRFYMSAGIAVYLRLQIPQPVAGLTSPDADGSASGYIPDLESPESVSLWIALVRFLSERYPGIAGFVLPGPLNDPATAAGADFSSPWVWAEQLAHLYTFTYNAARTTNSDFRKKYWNGANTVSAPYDIAVCLPLAEHPSGSSLEGTTLTLLFARSMGTIGNFPWTCLSCAGNDLGAPKQAAVTEQALIRHSLQLPRSVMYLYQPSGADLTAAYKEELRRPPEEREISASYTEFIAYSYTKFAAACGEGTRAVFFSLENTSLRLNHDFYETLKQYEIRSEKTDSIKSGTAVPAEGRYIGGVSGTVWDFSDAYSSLGWIPGGGALSYATESSVLYQSRVLAFDFLRMDAENGQSAGTAGLAIRNLGFHADLSSVDSVLFDFTVDAPKKNGQTVSLFFVIGGNENRSEFYAEGVHCGERQQLLCDISGWDGRNVVDYIAVAVYADSEVSLKLKSVSAAGSLSSPEEIRALFFPPEDSGEGEEDKNYFSLIAAMTAVIAAAATVFVLLTRQDKAYRSEQTVPDSGRKERRMI